MQWLSRCNAVLQMLGNWWKNGQRNEYGNDCDGDSNSVQYQIRVHLSNALNDGEFRVEIIWKTRLRFKLDREVKPNKKNNLRNYGNTIQLHKIRIVIENVCSHTNNQPIFKYICTYIHDISLCIAGSGRSETT